ncbi:MAG: bifunctional precorrin-2 dehydrogenase/sirohydrochlorin ferrochelatase [Bacteroidota bacterium]
MSTVSTPPKEGNRLFPVFFKLEQLRLLIVGGGNIGLEKLEAVLKNSPQTTITLVASAIDPRIRAIAEKTPTLHLLEKSYETADLAAADLVILATNDNTLNAQIRQEARAQRLLINVADKPALCDFYLGAVVQKGHLKIAISTNGKSPTIAKRVKETFNEVFPAQIDDTLTYLQAIRNRIKGDFTDKVNQLNAITEVLVEAPAATQKRRKWQQIVGYVLIVSVSMGVGHLLFSWWGW